MSVPDVNHARGVSTVRTRLSAVGVELQEPRRGYRFGPESPAIVDFVLAAHRVLDLGAGCGVIGLALAARFASSVQRLTLIERNAELAAIARLNVRSTAVGEVIEHDLRECEDLGEFDLVVANPPFFEPGAGLESANPTTRGATHRHAGGPLEFAAAGARHLANDGSLWMLHPCDRLAEVLDAGLVAGLHAVRLVILDARHSDRPYRAWVEFRRVPVPLEIVRACVITAR